MHRLKKLIERISGYWIYRREHLPVGTDIFVDLDRFNRDDFSIIFDVGANIGQTASRYLDLFPKAKIYSFEPVTATYEALQKNMSKNKRVLTFQHAFGLEEEKVEISLNPNPVCSTNSLNKQVMNQDPEALKETLDVKKLDEFMVKHQIEKIDFLKIDTEGWEIQVLSGAQDAINQKKINLILCEVGFTNENSRNTRFDDLNKFMSEKGYYFYGLYDISLRQLISGGHYGDALYVSSDYLEESRSKISFS